MAIYAMSDIHGHLKEFNEMLHKIKFSITNDELYILGDCIDWGGYSIELIQRILELKSMGAKIKSLMGNHEDMMYKIVKRLKLTDTLEDIRLCKTRVDTYDLYIWMENGGAETITKYLRLSNKEKVEILDWLESLEYTVDVKVENKKYHLSHSYPRINGIKKDQIIWNRINDWCIAEEFVDQYPYYTLVSGHTPVSFYKKQSDTDGYKIYKSNIMDYINIDCGAKVLELDNNVRLGCIRLGDEAEFYVSRVTD